MHSPEWYEKRDTDAFLESIGCYIVKPTTGGFGSSGTADRIACYRGRFVSLEIKRPGGKPTALQSKRLREVQEAGGISFCGDAAKVIGEMKAWIASL